MFELLGITLSIETVATLAVALIVDEVLPFLPGKANGIVHAIVLGLKKSKLGRHPSKQEDKLDLVLAKLEALEQLQETGTKIDNVLKQVRGR
jgi:hypothetical protein